MAKTAFINPTVYQARYNHPKKTKKGQKNILIKGYLNKVLGRTQNIPSPSARRAQSCSKRAERKLLKKKSFYLKELLLSALPPLYSPENKIPIFFRNIGLMGLSFQLVQALNAFPTEVLGLCPPHLKEPMALRSGGLLHASQQSHHFWGKESWR